MENNVLDLLKDCVVQIEKKMESFDSRHIDTGIDAWYNREWKSGIFRRAHLEVLDEMEKHNVYLIHFCVFPYLDDPAPVFGMDYVFWNGVLSGAFHDFSPMGETPMNEWFIEEMKDVVPDKRRPLPDWMSEVSSPAMLSTTALEDYDEAKSVVDRLLADLDYYLENVATADVYYNVSYAEQLNKYCSYQKKNPHIKGMLKSFGYDMDIVDHFVDTYLFPEV